MFVKKIKPRLDILNYFARAVTPKEQTKRFNARFFYAMLNFVMEQSKKMMNY